MLGEKILSTIVEGGVTFEVVEKAETIYAGRLSYAQNLIDEPDIGGMFEDVRKNDILSKVVGCNEPEWTMAISIDYWQGGAVPRGFMFAKETTTDLQPQDIDIYKMPSSLFIRVFHDDAVAKLLGKDSCEIWELFGFIKNVVLPNHGFKMAENGAQEMEYYNWSKYNRGFAYVPVVRV